MCNNSTRCARCCNKNNCGCGWFRARNGASEVVHCVAPEGASLAYLTLTSQSVEPLETIPLTAKIFAGSKITPNAGGAELSQGLYEISYSLTASSAIAGTQSVEVRLDNVLVEELKSSITATPSNLYTMSGNGLVQAPMGGGLLTLVNAGANTQGYANVGLTIKKLG